MASSSEESDVESVDSDKELQVAFSQGLLKPGLNIPAPAPKTFINDKEGLAASLAELQSDLAWVERLDLTVTPTQMPRPLAALAEGAAQDAAEEDDSHDDFKREMRFYCQAQATVLEGIPKLHALGIKTKRPEDYYAEMAKTDAHMQKVRQKLIAKQVSMERTEKARKMRELRKYGKKVQQDVLQKRQKEKREMMDAMKKVRKGKEAKLDFLKDDGSGPKNQKSGQKGGPQNNKQNQIQPNKKRQHKNEKFGFGGQKKRSKYNTKESAKDMSQFNAKKHASRPTGKFNKVRKATNNRPGKNRRQKIKNRKK